MNIPSIESLLSELDKYKRAYESADRQILSLKEQRNRLTAERDRFANMISESSNRWQEMMAALREAKEALVMNIVGTGGRTPAAHNAIATINKVLGEE